MFKVKHLEYTLTIVQILIPQTPLKTKLKKVLTKKNTNSSVGFLKNKSMALFCDS